MASRDPNTRDLTHQPLRIADDVMVWPVRERGELVYRIEIPKFHRFFRVGYEEYVLISLLDGTKTIPQACGLAAAKLGSRAPTAAQAATIARWLLENGIAHLDGQAMPSRRQPIQSRGASKTSALGWIARWNPFWIKLPLPKSERLINAAARTFRPVFAPPSVALGLATMMGAWVVLTTRWDEFAGSTIQLLHPSNWIWVLLMWVLLKVIHELAHAVACERQGGSVRESGFVLILLAPLAYVDVTSCWRMDSRWSRIAVSAAGMFVEMSVASLALLWWSWIDDQHWRFLLHNLVFTAGLSTLLFNANVLMRFDGYFILTDLVEIPNLYAEASSMLRRLARRLIAGESIHQGSLDGWRRYFTMAYAWAALTWRVAICVSLTITAATMFAGAGIVIAGLGVVLWLGQPLRQTFHFFVSLRQSAPTRFIRAIAATACFISITLFIFVWLPIPTAVRIPAVARYISETTMRSRANGFVTTVHVGDGQEVRAGEVLIELQNRELSHRLAQLKIARQQNEIRLRQATGIHDAGERQVLMENQRTIRSQLDQLQRQIDGLRLRASRNGRIVAPGLDQLQGTYVREGDPIAIVASPTDKEIVAVIDQESAKYVQPLIGQPVAVRDAGYRFFRGTLERVEPRADDRLFEPSLAASEGGPLVVRTAGENEDQTQMRLTQPHFRGRIRLKNASAEKLPVGMRMQVAFCHRLESLSSRLRNSIRRLWHASRDSSTSD